MPPVFHSAKDGYANMWKSMKVTRPQECDAAARKILASKARYKAVEAKTGVPWFFQAILHMRESNNDFGGVLHNGEHIIGTGRKTRLVPAGRGPFTTWEEAAVDALKIKNLDKIDWNTDTISRIGYHGEEFNGWGYTNKGINSPYVWGGSNHQQPGKYIADRKFDPHAVDKQLGIMPVLYRLSLMDEEVAARLQGGKGPIVSKKDTVGGVVAVGTGAAGGVLATLMGWDWGIIIPVGITLAAIGFVVGRAMQRASS